VRLSRRVLLGALGGVLVASGPGGGLLGGTAPLWAQRPTGSEIRIGALLPFAGPWADWGKKDKVALEIAVEEINDEGGGIHGVPVKLLIEDTGSKPQEAAVLTRRLATDARVLAIIGPFSSSEAEVAFPLGNQFKVPMIAQASSKPGIGAANRPWAFRMNVDEGRYAQPAVRRFVKEYNVKAAAVIHDAKDAVGQFIGTRVLPTLLKQNGVSVVNDGAFLTFQSRDIDFSAQVTKLKAMQFDGIAFGGAYADALTFLKEARRQGLRQPMVGGNPLMNELLPKQGGEATEGTIAPSFFWPGDPAPRVQTLVKKFAARATAAGLPPTIEQTNVNAYEALHLLADIMRKGDITNRPEDLAADRERIMKGLTATRSWPGVAGRIGFDDHGDGVKEIHVFMIKGGTWTKIE
jgi:branched-chain amino acid transport system substrate-binding protein